MKLNAKKVKVGKTIQVKLTLKNGNKKALNKQKSTCYSWIWNL